MNSKFNPDKYLAGIRRLDPKSRKGENGKVLLIGGSKLFHAASRWSLDVVSAMADMVFYSSVPENNELIREAKGEFWDGVVVPRGEVENYIIEADVILIGPGMTRASRQFPIINYQLSKPTEKEWEEDTQKIVNYLLSNYPEKKWVIDAGALQMLDPLLLNNRCIITPHHGEWDILLQKLPRIPSLLDTGVTVLLKGEKDIVMQGEKKQEIEGGNPGMTKGGTGDALAGLVAGLYATTDDPFTVAVVSSFVCKKAGDQMFLKVGPFFKTSDLVHQIPLVLKELLY